VSSTNALGSSLVLSVIIVVEGGGVVVVVVDVVVVDVVDVVVITLDPNSTSDSSVTTSSSAVHSGSAQSQDSISSPEQWPPFLAGIITFLFLDLEADAPQVPEQGDQPLHSDQRQSVGNNATAMDDIVVVEIPESVVSASLQVLSSSDKNNLGGQVHL
jgi:hypothetical protein